MKAKTLITISFFVCGSISFAMSFSLAKLSLANATKYDKEIEAFDSISSGVFGGRFIPSDFFYFQGQIAFEIADSVNFFHVLPAYQKPAEFFFNGASLQIPTFFKPTISVAAFTGSFENLSSGSLLQTQLKTPITEPEFIGMPQKHQEIFSNEIQGLGLMVNYSIPQKPIACSLDAYWNALFDDQLAISEDFRIAFSSELLNLVFFSGLKHEVNKGKTFLRSGLTSVISPSDDYQMYSLFGVRDLNIKEDTVKDSLFLLFESRFSLRKTYLSFAFFSSPLSAQEQMTGFNSTVRFGKLEPKKLSGGLSFFTYIDTVHPSPFTPLTITMSPFLNYSIGDAQFDIVSIIKPLAFQNISEIIEVQLKYKAVF